MTAPELEIIKICKVHGALMAEQVRVFRTKKRCIQCIHINDRIWYQRNKQQAIASRKKYKIKQREKKDIRFAKIEKLRMQTLNMTWSSPEMSFKLHERINRIINKRRYDWFSSCVDRRAIKEDLKELQKYINKHKRGRNA
jgi:hypothetical protein